MDLAPPLDTSGTLLQELARHEPADALERTHLAAIRRLVACEPACFSRSTFVPGHITGSAFIVDPAGRLLLHHHRKLDRWLQMGGHDDGELDPRLTAFREAREESGLIDLVLVSERILDVDVHAIPGSPKRNEPAHLHHDVRYLFVTSSPDLLTQNEAESYALAFFALDEAVRRLADPSAERVVEKIRRAIAS